MDTATTELAIRALENERDKLDTERNKIEAALRELRSQFRTTAPSVVPETQQTPTKRRISAAGRKRIAEANKRRWEKVRGQAEAAPPSTVTKKAAKKTASKKSGLTPEGRARLAEAVRKRNIAKRAAAKKTATKSA